MEISERDLEIAVALKEIENRQKELLILAIELEKTRRAIERIKEVEGKDILVNIGSNCMVRARIESVEKILVPVGAGIVLEKTPEEAKKLIEERLKDIESAVNELERRKQELWK
jgi:prefoldin alpha subunit